MREAGQDRHPPGVGRHGRRGFAAGRDVTLRAESAGGAGLTFQASVRIDTPQELEYYRHGGILQYVLRQLLGRKRS